MFLKLRFGEIENIVKAGVPERSLSVAERRFSLPLVLMIRVDDPCAESWSLIDGLKGEAVYERKNHSVG